MTTADVGSPRVLVVEDDPELQATLVTLLAEDGYRVESACDGQRGLHLGLTRTYDMLLLDRRLRRSTASTYWAGCAAAA